MKKYCLLILLLLFINPIFGQLLLEEKFNYTVGTTLSSNGWTAHSSGGTNPILVTSPGLTYNGYIGSGGNCVSLLSNGEDINKTFDSQTSGALYFSAMINVSSAGTNGEYFLHFYQGTSTYNGRLYVKKDASNNLAFGILKSASGTAVYTNFIYSMNTTYLIVLKYEFISGTTNDIVTLWINPTLSLTEPAFILSAVDNGADVTSFTGISLRQGATANNVNVKVGGIRVGKSWIDSPMPVELSYFSCEMIDGGIELNWKTENEVHNYGFYIERADGTYTWKTIGFVLGHGYSNSPKNYSFKDKSVPNFGKYFYRLKQMDITGEMDYSNIITINYFPDVSFYLNQNYPNPFNSNTIIKYTIPNETYVVLKIFDSQGNEIDKLVDEKLPKGIYYVTFDANQFSSGTYFCQITANSMTQIKKMVLLK